VGESLMLRGSAFETVGTKKLNNDPLPNSVEKCCTPRKG